MAAPKTEKVILTANRASPLWAVARADVNSAFLPFVLSEFIQGNVDEVVVTASEWAKLQGYFAGLSKNPKDVAFAVADAPEPAKPEASTRAAAARKLAELVRQIGACSPFGGDVLREEGGRYYVVTFARGSDICGVARIYGPAYVMVMYLARTADAPPNGLPVIDNRVFGSLDDAAKFLTLAMHKRDYAAAMAVPLRPVKARKNETV